MLYDQNWNKTDEQKVLLSAANYIEEHGWCRGDLIDDKNRPCILGAIKSVCPDWNVQYGAALKVRDTIYRRTQKYLYVTQWNDVYCSGGDAAADLLREAAQ